MPDFVVFINNVHDKRCPKIPTHMYARFLEHIKLRYDESEWKVDSDGNILVWETDVKRARVSLSQFIQDNTQRFCKCCGHELKNSIPNFSM